MAQGFLDDRAMPVLALEADAEMPNLWSVLIFLSVPVFGSSSKKAVSRDVVLPRAVCLAEFGAY
jgi:hypothetical protein